MRIFRKINLEYKKKMLAWPSLNWICLEGIGIATPRINGIDCP
jgi:hypothetical protein